MILLQTSPDKLSVKTFEYFIFSPDISPLRALALLSVSLMEALLSIFTVKKDFWKIIFFRIPCESQNCYFVTTGAIVVAFL